MARLFVLFTLIFAFGAFAQTKAFSVPKTSTCNTQVSGGQDINNPTDYGTGHYYAYKDGCTSKVIDVSTAEVVYQLDLKGVGANTESQYSYVTLYRNLTDSDNSWAAIYTEISLATNPYTYTNGVIAGDKLQILSKTSTASASLNLDGSNLYIVVNEPDRTDFYIARNNVSVSALPRLEFPKREHASKGFNLWSDVNAIGQKMTDGSLSRNIRLLR
ncbi:hypothetical protein SAMN05720470_10873 [Fibrobacter sp. UWOV1]|uniref:hypothetical protein n=1 Tax=Fibrobacter sp. UWOV1 TaxID=1896215 RepID=UPI0009245329|nr:hypothetical protein [Fibrobacter sp. UWOV1]SHL43501.1 hypothetical protein SAMN05720470_10873 [Fibrobacter sp. UWOV1]